MKKHPPLPAAFESLGIELRFLKALAKMRFEEPSDIQKKLIPVAQYWLDNPVKGKKTYTGIAFAPEHEGDRTPDGRLNLWRGFSVQPKPGSWSYLEKLILETICSGDADSFEYILNWLARAVQRPAEPG